MTQDQMLIAIEWLRVNEGEGGEEIACSAVADWLERELKRREKDAMARAVAREHGVTHRLARAAIDRLEAQAAAGLS